MFDLTGKIAVVTGAGSGIGEAIAVCLSGAGAAVYVLDRDESAGSRVAARLPRGRFLRVDVTDPTAVAAAAQTILAEQAGRVDVLVNNAGIGHVGTILTTAPE